MEEKIDLLLQQFALFDVRLQKVKEPMQVPPSSSKSAKTLETTCTALKQGMESTRSKFNLNSDDEDYFNLQSKEEEAKPKPFSFVGDHPHWMALS